MNEILIDNGFTPEWISKAREIREEKNKIRKKLHESVRFLNKTEIWNSIMSELKESVDGLNKKIHLFNLVVPILNKQMLLFDLNKEIEVAKSLPPLEVEKPNNNEVRQVSADSNTNIFVIFQDIFKRHG